MALLWLYASQFVICKVGVDAFSLLYSNILIAKLSLVILGAKLYWQFVSICGCFIRD